MPELTELIYEQLELTNWTTVADTTQATQIKRVRQIESGNYWQPDKEQFVSRVLLTVNRKIASNSFTVRSVVYNKFQSGKTPVNTIRSGLFVHTPSRLKSFAIGTFRIQAGEGLNLGCYCFLNKDKNDIINPAPALTHPALTGAAAELGDNDFSIVGWLSQTTRFASLQEGKISKLYESSLVDADTKDKVHEQTGGLVAAWKLSRIKLGGYWFEQVYDYGFVQTIPSPQQDFYGLFAEYKAKPFTLAMENGFTGSVASRALRLEHQMPLLSQKLRYYYRADAFPSSYARTQQVFGQKTASEEISWDIAAKPLPHYSFTCRIAAVKDISDITETHWKERLILGVSRQDKGRRIGLTYYRFKKDTVPFYDSLATDILPTQNRFKAAVRQALTKHLDYQITAQYQHYLDRKVTRNGFSLQHTIFYDTPKTDISLSLITRSNQKSLYQPTDILTDDELLIQSDSDTDLRLHISYKFSKVFNASLSVYRPLKQADRQSLRLNLQAYL